MKHDNSFDVIVIGGGHAGTEAAAVAARMGARTALITQKISAIGAMSCNPAIGGLGKGHLVREIDAMDGLMGRAADAAAIQFRLLNRRKGPAVQGPRIQADRKLYRSAVLRLLATTQNLTLVEGECVRLVTSGHQIKGVQTVDGQFYGCGAVVLTTGTFLNGMIHRGEEKFSAGRIGDPATLALAQQLRELDFQVSRLKTGTPPRLDGRTIDFAALEPQWGDEDPQFMSSLSCATVVPQTLCFITRTTKTTHAIVRKNIHRTAVYSGAIEGSGPRYCPSIEDKVARFADRESHQIFLEPEGLDSHSIYPNGISTSLPSDVQRALLRSVPGLEEAEFLQAGYAIEYDYINPEELTPDLMTRRVAGLFLAGQIIGTTGYEEAASLGLAAGIGAAQFVRRSPHRLFDRTNSYLGVMIDDLVTRGVTEPYRMFTSRAEFRLSLRADNAEDRLTPLGIVAGAVGEERTQHFRTISNEIVRARQLLNELRAHSSSLIGAGIEVSGDGARRSAFEWLGLSNVAVTDLARVWPEIHGIPTRLLSRLDADAKYSVYIARQQKDIARQKADEQLEIPSALDINSIAGLSNEIKARFRQRRPATLGQASRFEGVTPAALLLLAAHAKRSKTN